MGSVLHATKFSMGKGKLSHNDKPTFVIYGFLLKLQFLLTKIRPDLLVFAIDSPNSKRKKIFAAYKEKRHKNKTEEQNELDKLAYPQFDEIKNYVIPKLGYSNVFSEDGLEADDIIGSICKTYTNSEIVVVSNDGDLYQLLTDKIVMFDPRVNQYFGIEDFIKKYKMQPPDWKKVKVYGGCTTDEVPGIRVDLDGNGKTTVIGKDAAIKYVSEGNLSDKKLKALNSEKGKKQIQRNKSLVILPFRGTPTYEVSSLSGSKTGLKEVAQKYGFKSILGDLNNWNRILRLM